MSTVQDLCTDAMEDLGFLAADQVPAFSDSNFCFRRLNRLLNQFAAESMMIYTMDSGVFTFNGASTYTVGVGGNCPILRPVLHDLITVVWFDSTSGPPVAEYPLEKFTDNAWFNVTNKALTSTQPSNWWWKADFPLASITLWPIPSANATRFGRIYYPRQITEFVALTDTVSLPPAYERMLVSNLALEVAPGFGVDPPGVLVKTATESLAVVRRANRKLSDLSFPWDSLIGGNRSFYDIRTG